VDLPSFLWLWRIAAWSMGLAIAAYLLQAVSGGWLWSVHNRQAIDPAWLRPLHIGVGITMVGLVLLLLAIGIVGTLGHYGSLGHSLHLPAGLIVVSLVLVSAWSATQISPDRPWARPFHLSINLMLLVAFALVSLSGWIVVQKYLPD